jgi:hypothetical protein
MTLDTRRPVRVDGSLDAHVEQSDANGLAAVGVETDERVGSSLPNCLEEAAR